MSYDGVPMGKSVSYQIIVCYEKKGIYGGGFVTLSCSPGADVAQCGKNLLSGGRKKSGPRPDAQAAS